MKTQESHGSHLRWPRRQSHHQSPQALVGIHVMPYSYKLHMHLAGMTMTAQAPAQQDLASKQGLLCKPGLVISNASSQGKIAYLPCLLQMQCACFD